MSISLKTRKALWAKSGNRCAICRLELVQSDELEGNLILGEECHIISSKANGPRGKEKLHCDDFDDLNNLLLLCANDHKRIDTQTEVYSADKLIKLKKSHEDWVKDTLNIDPTAFANDKLKISSLRSVKTGKDLLRLVDGVHGFIFDNDSLNTKSEIDSIPSLFDLLKEYVDILDLLNFSDKAEIELDLGNRIREIEKLGFLIFGDKRNVGLKDSNNLSLGRWDMTTIVIVRNDNPCIVDDFIIIQTPNNYRFRI